MKRIFRFVVLTSRQERAWMDYFEGMKTAVDVAKEMNMSRQHVYQKSASIIKQFVLENKVIIKRRNK